MKQLSPTSNFANKVRNTKLPRTKPLLPLFEVISNSIHAINESKKVQAISEGKIRVKLIRNGQHSVLQELTEVDGFPIHSFEVVDNGIGLTDENLKHFVEADTDHKIDIGGKGVGRFVCLKAFKSLKVKSCYSLENKRVIRQFEFKPTKEAFHDYIEDEAPSHHPTGTSITLSVYREEYLKHTPLNISDIARAIATHFQLYFIQKNAPSIILENQNSTTVNLKTLFSMEFEDDIQEKEFTVGEYAFKIYLAKSYTAQSHKLHFCAHNRSVREEGLAKKLVDLGKYSIKTENGDAFYYQAFIVGNVLDENVDLERVGFNFPNDIDEDEEDTMSFDELTLAKIRNQAILCIEDLISDYLNKVREEKIEKYKPTIEDSLPQYRSTLHYKLAEIKKLPPNLSKPKLDVELYKITNEWMLEVKERGVELLDEKKDITNLEEYKEKYEEFLTQFNEIGQAELARYIIHRKSVIELLDKFIGKETETDKFTNEDIIHSIFFPIRSSSDEVPFNKQNLWLLDERLTYHSFLSSDRTFERTGKIQAANNNRSDLLIFNDAISFTEDKHPPYSSFTIVEFKKPMRNNYEDYDPKKNPLDQVELYIDDLLAGKVTNRQGREIKVTDKTPFYIYIVCDITPTFEAILKKREFTKTPDGQGYFTFKSKYYSAYIEVLPFEKVLSDARKRNRILFEKLGLHTS